MSSRLAATTSPPNFASAFAFSELTSQVRARNVKAPPVSLAMARTKPPPCAPVAPTTAMIFSSVMSVLPSFRVQLRLAPLNDSPFPAEDRKPRLWPPLRERKVRGLRVCLEAGRFYEFHLETLGERVMQLLPRHSPRTLARWFLIAETHQEQSTAGLKHGRKPLNVAATVIVGEDVEQPGIDYAGEPLVPVAKPHCVLDDEVRPQAPLGRLDPGSADWSSQKVDASDPMAVGGEEQGILPRTTAGVEDWAHDPVCDRHERGLRFADVPGGLPRVEKPKGGPVYQVAHVWRPSRSASVTRGCVRWDRQSRRPCRRSSC